MVFGWLTQETIHYEKNLDGFENSIKNSIKIIL